MARPLVERLGSEFYADEERIASGIDRRSSFNVIHLPTMFKVDIFLVGRDAWSESVVQRRRSVEVDDQGTRVLQVQGKRLDRAYLHEMAEELGVTDLLEELLQEGSS